MAHLLTLDFCVPTYLFGKFDPGFPQREWRETSDTVHSCAQSLTSPGDKHKHPRQAHCHRLRLLRSFLIGRRRRLFLARQPDYKPSVAPTPEEEGSTPWAFFRRKLPRKCWARELAVIESWHSLLAERDVTVGNSDASECGG